MKKNNYLFLACLIVGMTAFGQTSLFQTENHSDNARKVLIEEYSYPHTVTCISTYDGDASFVYSTPASTATQEVAVTNCYVNDMVIFGDTLFFCGINPALGKAVIGFFNIRDLFIYGTGNILVKENFVAGENLNPVKKLTRIESYLDDMLVRHVVSVGECNDEYPCLVDMAESFPGAWTYNAGFVYDTDESFEDVITADTFDKTRKEKHMSVLTGPCELKQKDFRFEEHNTDTNSLVKEEGK